jgi:hypothetical protein
MGGEIQRANRRPPLVRHVHERERARRRLRLVKHRPTLKNVWRQNLEPNRASGAPRRPDPRS